MEFSSVARHEDYDLRTCPECVSSDIIEDTSEGTLVCTSCGLVVSRLILDLSEEYRTFDDDEGPDQTRVSAAANPLLSTSLLTDIAAGGDRDSRSLQRTQHQTAQAQADKVLSNLFSLISELCGSLNVPGAVARAQMLAKLQADALAAGEGGQRRLVMKPDARKATASAAVILACREMGIHLTHKEVAARARVPPLAVGNAVRSLQTSVPAATGVRELGADLLVPRFATALGLPFAVFGDVEAVVRALREGPMCTRTAPTIVAIALYVMLAACGRNFSRKEIADVCGVGAGTILKRYREVYPDVHALLEGAVRGFAEKYKGKVPSVRERRSSVAVTDTPQRRRRPTVSMTPRTDRRRPPRMPQVSMSAKKPTVSQVAKSVMKPVVPRVRESAAKPAVVTELFPMGKQSALKDGAQNRQGGKQMKVGADAATHARLAAVSEPAVSVHGFRPLLPERKRKRVSVDAVPQVDPAASAAAAVSDQNAHVRSPVHKRKRVSAGPATQVDPVASAVAVISDEDSHVRSPGHNWKKTGADPATIVHPGASAEAGVPRNGSVAPSPRENRQTVSTEPAALVNRPAAAKTDMSGTGSRAPSNLRKRKLSEPDLAVKAYSVLDASPHKRKRARLETALIIDPTNAGPAQHSLASRQSDRGALDRSTAAAQPSEHSALASSVQVQPAAGSEQAPASLVSSFGVSLDERSTPSSKRKRSEPDASKATPEILREAPVEEQQTVPVISESPPRVKAEPAPSPASRNIQEDSQDVQPTPNLEPAAGSESMYRALAQAPEASVALSRMVTESSTAAKVKNVRGNSQDPPPLPKQKAESLEHVRGAVGVPIPQSEAPADVRPAGAKRSSMDEMPIRKRKRTTRSDPEKDGNRKTDGPDKDLLKELEKEIQSGLPARKRRKTSSEKAARQEATRRSPEKKKEAKVLASRGKGRNLRSKAPAQTKQASEKPTMPRESTPPLEDGDAAKDESKDAAPKGKGRKKRSKASARTKPTAATKKTEEQAEGQGVRRSARVRKRMEKASAASKATETAPKKGRKKRGRK